MSVSADLSYFTLTLSAATALFGTRDLPSGSSRGPLDELPGTSELDLIARLRQDDHTAFELIYRTLHPRLIAIAQSYVHSAAIAEELAQDVLLLAWDRRTQWKESDSIVVYLYATTRNRALTYRRHEGVVGRVTGVALSEGQSIGTADPADRPDEVLEREDLVAAVTRVLRTLPDTQQTAFTLRWIHQLDYDAIAAIMGLSPVSVRKHVSRARAALISIVADLKVS